MAHQTRTLFQKYFGSWLKIGILAGVLVMASVFFYIGQEAFIRSEVVDYFPATCLGSWQATDFAQGEPETFKFPDGEISSDNAAFLDKPNGEIYCGQFLPSEATNLGEIKGVGLTLVWKVDSLPEVVLPEATVLPEPTSTLTNGENVSEENSANENALPVSGDLPIEEGVEDVQPTEEVTPPSSLNRIFVPVVLAQEAEPAVTEAPAEVPRVEPVESEAPAVTPEAPKVESPESEVQTNGESVNMSDEKVESAPGESESNGEETKAELDEPAPPLGLVEEPVTELIFNPTSEADESFLRVSYSLDGQEWKEVAKIDATNWWHFTAPLNISSWEDLRKIQFKIEGIPTTLSNFPEIYLDGMFLEVQYEKPPIVEILEEEKLIQEEPITDVELPENLPVIIVPEEDGLKPAPGDRSDFTPNETPSFDLDFENLPAPSEANEAGTTRADPRITKSGSLSVNKGKSGVWKNSAFGFLNPSFFMGRFFLSLGNFRLLDKAFAQDEATGRVAVLSAANPVVAQVVDAEGKPTRIAPTILTVNNKLRVNVPEPKRSLRPGVYKLKVWVLRDNQVYFSETDFTWGVFAINFDKSIYTPGDTANVGMAVLDDGGHTICDANVSLRIVLPTGGEQNFSTRDGSIIYSDTCGPDNVTSEADYKTSLVVNATGTYKIFATTRTSNGLRDFEDSFDVLDEPKFDVLRSGPTRIYPPAEYRISVKITPREDFKGVVKEIVPAEFRVVTNVSVEERVVGEEKILIWDLDLKAGEMREISYIFKAPDISPEFYKLGPLSFYQDVDDIRPIFSEVRSWQIASDAVQGDGSALIYGDANDDDQATVVYISATSTAGGENAVVDVGAGAGGTTFDIQHVRVVAAPTRNEFVMGQKLNNGRMDFVYSSGTTWGSLFNATSGLGTQACNTTMGSCTQDYDVGYEQLSGRAVIVYGSSSAASNNIVFQTWDGNSLSGPQEFFYDNQSLLCGGSSVAWIRFIPKNIRLTDKRSNEGMLLLSDNTCLYAAYWDGSSFVTSTNLGAAFGTQRTFDGAWETDSGDFVLVYDAFNGLSDSTTNTKYKVFSGGSWSNAATAITTASARGAWIHMDSDPLSDRLSLGVTVFAGAAPTVGIGYSAMWKQTSTAAWSLGRSDTSLESPVTRGVVTAWERFGTSDGTSTALFTFNDSAAADASDYHTWTPTTLGSLTDIPSGWTDDGNTRKLVGHPNADDMVWFGVDSDNDLNDQYWYGTGWNATGTELHTAIAITTDGNASPQENNAFDFAWKPYSPWSLNWRWYNGSSTADTPTPALANENASATISAEESVRLRFNVAERGGNSQTDARKKLQWTTSTTPDASSTVWTDVDDIGGSGIWRYYDADSGSSVGDDGTVIASAQLSSSTHAGWWTTDKDAAANSNMDHASTTIRELEFALDANGPTEGTLYYFRMYDVGQGSPVYRQQTSWPATPCASNSTCSYPSLLVAAPTPSVSDVKLNNSVTPFTLLPNMTSTISVSFNIFDSGGCSDILTNGNVTTTVYRSGVLGTCSLDDRNCYKVSTTTHNCAGGNSANATSSIDLQYFAQATDAGSAYEAQYWEALVESRDASNNTSSATSSVAIDVSSLVAIELVTSTINYGSLNPTSTTGAVNRIIPVKNVGNSSNTIQVYGSALKMGSYSIATSSQHYASSSFIFGGNEGQLSNTATTISGLTLLPNTSSTNSLGNWTDTQALPTQMYDLASFYNDGYVYAIGGLSASAPIGVTSTVRFAAVASDGSLGAWTNTTALPGSLQYPMASAHAGYVYVLTGAPGGSGTTTTVKYASINSNGTINSWSDTTALPYGVQQEWDSIAGYGGYLYFLGGTPNAGASRTSTVSYAAINETGALGSWIETTALPEARYSGATAAANGHLYYIGGYNSSNVQQATVYYAPINSDGTIGNWGTTTVLPNSRGQFQLEASGEYLYVLAGEAGGSVVTSSVLYGKINSDGTVTAWNQGVSLSTNTNEHAAASGGGFVYVLGGLRLTGSSATSSVFYSNITNGLSTKNTFWGLGLSDYVPTGTYMGSTTFIGTFAP